MSRVFFGKALPIHLPTCELHFIICCSPRKPAEDGCNLNQGHDTMHARSLEQRGKEMSSLRAKDLSRIVPGAPQIISCPGKFCRLWQGWLLDGQDATQVLRVLRHFVWGSLLASSGSAFLIHPTNAEHSACVGTLPGTEDVTVSKRDRQISCPQAGQSPRADGGKRDCDTVTTQVSAPVGSSGAGVASALSQWS